MEQYFGIRYEFDPPAVDRAIERQIQTGKSSYICVSDGVVVDNVHNNPTYGDVINGGMFSICDSSFVPLYLRWIYGIDRSQYCGHDLFMHVVGQRKYRMMFLGTSRNILDPLRQRLTQIDPAVADMKFEELPFADVDGFDYEAIGKMVNDDAPDIIWVALGAPKQEQFMNRLRPFVNRGVLISVGAVFKFVAGVEARRAPRWVVKAHLEFIYRIFSEPRKQLRRCRSILGTLPAVLIDEYKRSKAARTGSCLSKK